MTRLAVGIALVIGIGTASIQADPAEHVERSDLESAEREYRRLLQELPSDPIRNYNLGTVLLLRGRHEEAKSFLRSAAVPETDAEGIARYNLGNADLEPAFADRELSDRNDRLRQAIDAYRSALLLDPGDQHARWNLELAQRLLNETSPPTSGGGGGGGGGTSGPPTPGRELPAPLPSTSPGPEPNVTESEAEELLRSAQEHELQVQRDRLRKPQPERPRP